MRTLLLLFLVAAVFAGLVKGAAISPMEIAEARQRCTTQCANPNHKEAATCMRQCWATFFADRKAHRISHPVLPAPPATKARSVAATVAHKPEKKSPAAGKSKLVHPHVKGRSTVAAAKVAAPFSHARHVRTAASQLAGLGVFLIALFLMMIQ